MILIERFAKDGAVLSIIVVCSTEDVQWNKRREPIVFNGARPHHETSVHLELCSIVFLFCAFRHMLQITISTMF